MASRFIDPNSIVIDPTAIILGVVSENPRKVGTRGHAFFPRYVVGETVGDLLAKAKADKIGNAPAHIRWDLSRKAVVVTKYDRTADVAALAAFDDAAVVASMYARTAEGAARAAFDDAAVVASILGACAPPAAQETRRG